MAQEQLRSMLGADTYHLWFAPVRASGKDNSSLTLEVANDFCEIWLKDNYLGLLRDAVAVASGQQLQIKFRVIPTGGLAAVKAPTAERPEVTVPAVERKHGNPDQNFNPKHTFDPNGA
jgi:chromosomal replication initiator protein